MNHDDEFDRQIRLRIQEVVDAAPEPAPFPAAAVELPRSRNDSLRGSGPSRRSWLAAAAAVVIVVAAASAWMAVTGDRIDVASDGDDIDNARTIEAVHEVVSYSQSYELDCPDGSVERTGQFSEMKFETWGSSDSTRWTQTVTYPDGSSRTLLHVGDPWYPTEAFASEQTRGQTIGCANIGVLLSEPGQGSLYTLNPLAAVPTGPDGTSAVPQYDDLGEQVPGEHLGPSGQPVELWRQSISGDRSVGTEQVGVRQIKEWVVDPATSRVVRESFEDTIDGVGTVRWTATLERLVTDAVDASIFESDGMARQSIDDSERTVETPTTVETPN